MTVWFNDNAPEAVAALRELIRRDVIAFGDVDPRSIKDVTANDIAGYTQCHFFAGAGLWSIAARLAGWPDTRPLWTASCPCQPFSAAGRQAGADDPRHLWPDLYRIIRAALDAGLPVPILVGEQVAGAAGEDWFDGVRADLARENISARAIDIPACAVDAPHERQRQWWCAVANATGQGRDAAAHDGVCRKAQGERPRNGEPERLHGVHSRDVADANVAVLRHQPPAGQQPQPKPHARHDEGHSDGDRTLGDTIGAGLEGQRRYGDDGAGQSQQDRPATTPDGRNGTFWSDAEWIVCHDSKARRAKPSIPMLVDGMAGRIGLWRLVGNSIVPQLAAEVLSAILDIDMRAV